MAWLRGRDRSQLVVLGVGAVICVMGGWFAVYSAGNGVAAGVLLGIALVVLGGALLLQDRLGWRFLNPDGEPARERLPLD